MKLNEITNFAVPQSSLNSHCPKRGGYFSAEISQDHKTHLLGLSHFIRAISEWVNISNMPLSCLIELSGSWKPLLRFA